MSNKSQLNQLSKREILESLLARQQQDNSTINRLVIAVAIAAGLDAEAVAAKFADAEVTGTFADAFNKALDIEFAKRRQNAPAPQDAASEVVPSEDVV
jgi:2-hydroxychromene-2-carboxylate isomerase